VDALQEIEGPPVDLRQSPPPRPVRRIQDSDEFDAVNVATGAALSPLAGKPRGRGLTLVVIALIAAATGFAAFHYLGPRLGLVPQRAAVVAPSN